MPMFQKQYTGTPAEQIQKKMDDDAVRVERMQKKIEELEELIKELLKSKGGGAKDAEVDEELLKPLHNKDMKPPSEYSGSKKDFLS